MSTMPIKCNKCTAYLPIVRNSQVTPYGICDIVGDGQTCWTTRAEDYCAFERTNCPTLSQAEIEKRNQEAIERHESFEAHLKKASETFRQYPQWKQEMLMSILAH